MSGPHDDATTIQAEALLESLRRLPKTEPQLSDRLIGARCHRIACGDGEVAAWRLGAGPATLLVHGWDDDHRLWEPLIDHLIALELGVIVVDLPGHGFSTTTQCSYPYAAKALLAVAAVLGPVASVVAHSFGCAAAIFAISSGLEVTSAVLIAPPVPQDSLGWADIQRANGVPEQVVSRAIAIFETRSGVALAPYDMRRDSATMTARALFVHSIDDTICPPGPAEKVARLWPGSSRLMVEGLGHRRVARAPETIEAVGRFLIDARA